MDKQSDITAATLPLSDGGIGTVSLADGSRAARQALDRSPLGVVQIDRPPLDRLPYRGLVRALLAKQGFKLDFNRLAPNAAIALVADRLLGPGSFAADRAALAADIASLARFASGLVGATPSIAIRTYFAPGDLVWHVDRLCEAHAFRLLCPIGRPAGMMVTATDNIDAALYRAYMQREYPLLGRLDTRVMQQGGSIETLWAHRPLQVAAMQSGEFPFVRDPQAVWQVAPSAASIHRVDTPGRPGTFHRSCWANRATPGLQIVITVASDQP